MRVYFKSEGEIQIFSDIKIREIITSIFALAGKSSLRETVI